MWSAGSRDTALADSPLEQHDHILRGQVVQLAARSASEISQPRSQARGENETMYISIGTIVIILIIVFLILLLRRRFNEVIFHCCCFELTVTGSGPQAATSGHRLDAR